MKLNGIVSDRLSYSLRLDAFSCPDALFTLGSFPESGIFGSTAQTEPLELSLYEEYIKVTSFLSKNLDLTIGKQRIPWGTADKMNVVDNLNPVDLANFFTFDPDYFAERRPQTALNAEYYLSEMTKLQLVWLLSRQYAPLPAGFTKMLSQGYPETTIQITTEKSNLAHTNLGVRFSTVLFNTDLGLSYYHGNYHLSVLYGISAFDVNNIEHHYKYLARDIFGLDLPGELFSVGWWAEASCVRPEEVKGVLITSFWNGQTYQVVTKSFSLMEKGYFQWVLGADYTLGVGNGIYLNIQYLHGFFDEKDYPLESEEFFGFRQGMFFGEIEDYLVMQSEYKMFNENLKLELGVMVELAGGGTAVAYSPSAEYKVSDSFLIKSGAFIVTGNETGTKFGAFTKDKLAYLLFRLTF